MEINDYAWRNKPRRSFERRGFELQPTRAGIWGRMDGVRGAERDFLARATPAEKSRTDTRDPANRD